MAIGIHARRRDGVWRYRLWTTERDEYFSEEMNLDELKVWMIDERYTPRQVRDGRMDEELSYLLPELHEYGGRGTGRTKDVDGPWEEEMCEGCHVRHHAFKPTPRVQCSVCGNLQAHAAHGPACPVKEEPDIPPC